MEGCFDSSDNLISMYLAVMYIGLIFLKIASHFRPLRKPHSLAMLSLLILSYHAALFWTRAFKSVPPTSVPTPEEPKVPSALLQQVVFTIGTIGAVACGMETVLRQEVPSGNKEAADDWHPLRSSLDGMSRVLYMLLPMLAIWEATALSFDEDPKTSWWAGFCLRFVQMILELVYLGMLLLTIRAGRDILGRKADVLFVGYFLLVSLLSVLSVCVALTLFRM